MPFAIAEEFGRRSFFVNALQDDWSSLVESFGARGGEFEQVDVPCLPLTELVSIFGVPYFMKIDIEGLDDFCISQIEQLPSVPKYVSAEATVHDFARRLEAVGYRGFKLVAQRRASLHRLHGQDLEGFPGVAPIKPDKGLGWLTAVR